ncbi:hypothetical protein [Microvirga sp. VF16]|uniref:hypothetical protein n=1 Tax=Microvirga sp. VF16 TaxID=2807101 RepID=UPI00193D0BF3|nr:hypothetical protein [Microvirga sp. VF16]QRM34689.1 hypothetical protein JO965_41155 [Microvirga sp. VF16]
MVTQISKVLFSLLVAVAVLSGNPLTSEAMADEPADEVLASRFAYLSANGNSNCSREFEASIATMSSMQMLQGSCCSPMDKHRYIEQVRGLKAYWGISAIPTDPYDIPAGLASKLMTYYPLELTGTEQEAYAYAMANSDERGPCCCQCWRWKVYGGLAKYLIREHDFTGPQVAAIWDLSDGCGGGADHHH